MPYVSINSTSPKRSDSFMATSGSSSVGIVSINSTSPKRSDGLTDADREMFREFPLIPLLRREATDMLDCHYSLVMEFPLIPLLRREATQLSLGLLASAINQVSINSTSPKRSDFVHSNKCTGI